MEKSSRTSGRPGSPRARLFLALDLPDDAREAIAAWRDEAIAGRDDLRPVPCPALHVTLVFLGYRPEKEIDRIAGIAFDAIGGLRAPRLAADGIEPIPPRRPRLFALGLDDEDGRAGALHAAASAALEAARMYKPENRPFWPHLTIARVKRDRRADPLDAGPPPLGPFDATRVTLYRSRLRPQGAVYEPLATRELPALIP